MDGGVLIRYLGKWMLFGGLLGLPSRVGRVEASSGCAGVLESFFKLAFKNDFLRFWRDLGAFLGGLGRSKWKQKAMFWEVFFDAFFERDFLQIFCVFCKSEP